MVEGYGEKASAFSLFFCPHISCERILLNRKNKAPTAECGRKRLTMATFFNYANPSANTFIDLADATQDDLKRCFHYEKDATCTRGWAVQVQGKMYTALQYTWTDRFGVTQTRFALGHPAIRWSTRIGTVETFAYFSRELQVFDPTGNNGAGIAYLRLAIEPTAEEIVLYEERMRKQRERDEAKQKVTVELPKFMYTKW